MKSSIKIDFLDRGTGKGVEPVITVKIVSSDDPRDKLIKVLFESLGGESYLQAAYQYWDSRKNDKAQFVVSEDKEIILFRPESDVYPTTSNRIGNNFPARFGMHCRVEFNHQLSETESEKRFGTIAAVKFTPSKVFYDILDDLSAKVIEGIPSHDVFPPKTN